MLGLELKLLCHAHLFFFDGSFYLLLVLVQLDLCKLLIQTIIIDLLGFLQGLFKFYINIWIIVSVAEVTFALVFGVFCFLVPTILWKVIALCFIYVCNNWQVHFDVIKFIIDSVSIEWFVGGCSKIRSEIWCDSTDGPVALFVADGFVFIIIGLFNFSWVSGLCTLNRSWFPEVFVLLKLFMQAMLSTKCACAFLYFICCFCTGLKELSIIIISFNFFREVRARVLLLLAVLASKSLYSGWRNRVFKYFFHWLLSLGRCRSSHNLSKQTLPNILSLLILFLLLLFLIRLNLSHFIFDLHLIYQLFLSICYLLRHSLFLILVYLCIIHYFAFRFLDCFMINFKLFFFLDFVKLGVVQMDRHYELFTLIWVAQLSEFFDEDAWPVAYALDEFFFVGTGLLFLYFVENRGF